MSKTQTFTGLVWCRCDQFNQVVPHLALFFFSSRRRHTRFDCDWSSDVCSSDLERLLTRPAVGAGAAGPVMIHDDPVAKAAASIMAQRDDLSRDLVPRHVGKRQRSEERRVGKEGRSRWAPYH